MSFTENMPITHKISKLYFQFPENSLSLQELLNRTFEEMNFQFAEQKEHMFQFREHVSDSEKEKICKFGTT